MASRRTKNYKYPSKYAPKTWFNFSEHIAEIMCERLAVKHSCKLTTAFWEKEPWKKTFNQQIGFAIGLQKLYNQQAILNAIKMVPHVHSLGFRDLDRFIKREELKLKTKQEGSIVEVGNTLEKPREQFTSNKSLRDLDG